MERALPGRARRVSGSAGTPAGGGAGYDGGAAVAAWHALLDGDAGLAAASAEALEGALRRDGLVFGTRPLCTVLRPRFLTPAAYRALCTQVGTLLGAFRAAEARVLADPAARAQLRLTSWEEQLVMQDKSGVAPNPTTRLDMFVDGAGALRLTEFNGETPAAPAYNDALAEVMWDLPVTRRFARDWWVRPLVARHATVRVLLEAYERWLGRRAVPRVAILDWPEVPTTSEFLLFREAFERAGVPCVIGDPRACEYRGGRLWLDGAPVDLIYKRVLLHELVARTGLEGAVLRAVQDRAVCMLNGVRGKLLHKKASLAVVSDERNADWFDASARAAVAAHVPWTRVVEERTTMGPDGAPVDLLPWVAAHRTQLVLKPNDDYGGAGIVLGWTVSDAEWTAAVRRAVAEPYVVQQRVAIPREPYPSWVDGAVAYADRQVDTAPFVCDATYVEGVLTRLSTAELLNVTAGGGSQTPTFLVDPR